MWPLLLRASAWVAEQVAVSAIPYAIERILRGWGVDGKIASKTWDLGSGYDVEGERRDKMESNRAFLTKLVADEKYQPEPGGRTFCNIALQAYAHTFGIKCFDDKLANDICTTAADHPDFTIEKDPERVMRHASRGGFAFAGKKGEKHGHVAAVFPAPLVYSGSWKRSVCLVANIGKSNGIMPLSMAFPVKDSPPEYYVYKASEA